MRVELRIYGTKFDPQTSKMIESEEVISKISSFIPEIEKCDKCGHEKLFNFEGGLNRKHAALRAAIKELFND